MSDELRVAIEAAKQGAKAALKYFDRNPHVKTKLDNSPVTKADEECEETIKQVILRTFPQAAFLAEETGGSSAKDYLWVIDPIDGTKNFIRALPFWASEIAYVEKREIVVGVSFCPLLDELMYAEKGSGTFLNSKRVSVSKIKILKEAFLSHGTISYFGDNMDRLIKLITSAYRERAYGDFYGYHLVASGRADIMLDAKNGPWDIAALKVIVEEAGGKVTNFEGKEWSLNDSTAVATNSLLHDEVIRILNS